MEKIERISQISKIPNVMAAIDGNHIPNKTPQNNHEDYFNRKYFYSYVMQAVVGATESCEETLLLHVAVKWSIVTGSCILGIKTPLQFTALNFMGAPCDLFDVSMDIWHGKFTSGNAGHTTKYSCPW